MGGGGGFDEVLLITRNIISKPIFLSWGVDRIHPYGKSVWADLHRSTPLPLSYWKQDALGFIFLVNLLKEISR